MARTKGAGRTAQPTTRSAARAVVRSMLCVVSCAALALGPAGCGRGLVNRVTGSPSPSPTFLDEQTVCEVTSTDALREAVSFQTVDYEYWHDSYPNKPDQNSFQCRIRGRDASANLSPTAFYISYEPWTAGCFSDSACLCFRLPSLSPGNRFRPRRECDTLGLSEDGHDCISARSTRQYP